MITLDKTNRVEVENEFLALILNKNELFGITSIKPEYLCMQENKRMFEYCMECYQEFGIVNPAKILEKHKNFNVTYFCDVMTNVFYYNDAWEEQLKVAEESIIKYYKEDIIKVLNEKLKVGGINYDEFVEKVKKLDEIVLTRNTPTLTADEILKNINDDRAAIKFNKYPKLNSTLRLVRGDFLIIGATTGAGKSGLMLNLMEDLMQRYQCIYFNMEMSKATIYKRIVSINADVKVEDVNNPQTNYQEELINTALERIENSKIIIEHQANDINQIRAVVAKRKEKKRHTILFIDHLGLCKCDGKKNLYEQATEVAKQLRQMCLEYDCTIISASQLNRGAYSTEELTLSMLKDSGELENSASKVILLNRDKDCSKDNDIADMNVEIAKNRDGICGVIQMIYDKTKQIFKERPYDYRS